MPEYSKVMIRRSATPRRIITSAHQAFGRRMAEFDRRDPRLDKAWCGIPVTDAQIDRREGKPMKPRWSESVQAWIPVLSPRRRKGEERRGPLSYTRRYSSSTDPRIRALERRKA